MGAFQALPAGAQAGQTATSAASAWGYSTWVELSPSVASLSILAIRFQVTSIPAVDTTEEVIVEIGTGGSGAEVVQCQIAYSHRRDTAVGNYLSRPETAFLTEPRTITGGTRVAIRFADSSTSARTYAAVRILTEDLKATITGTINDTWGGWTGTSSATVSASFTEYFGTINTTWGGWSGTSSATVDREATTNTTWGGWSGTASGLVDHKATTNTTWGGWSGTASGLVDHKATIATTWGGWPGTSSATVEHPATAAGTWGGWTGTSAATVDRKAVINTTWPGWVGRAIIPGGGATVYIGSDLVTSLYLGSTPVTLE